MEPTADQLKEWIINLGQEITDVKRELTSENNVRRKKTIYRLPESVTNRHKEDYKPLAVSLGPYHNGEAQLVRMERYKVQAVGQFLGRSKKSLAAVVKAVNEIVKELRETYDDLDDKWQENNSKFLRMMILDGCFIIEILMGSAKKIYECKDYDEHDTHVSLGYWNLFDDLVFGWEKVDPIFGKQDIATLVRRDMLLIENQVPLQLLTKILHAGSEFMKNAYLLKLILKFCSPETPFTEVFTEDAKFLHILDVYRESMISKLCPARSQSFSSGPSFYKCIALLSAVGKFLESKFNLRNKEKYHIRRSATEINEAGIKIKSISKANQRISFEGTTLQLPKLFLNDASTSTFLNILAFEKFYENAGNQFISYLIFKNELITSVSDVSILKEKKIIYNSMGSDEDVIHLFHQLCREISPNQNASLISEWHVDISDKVNSYYSSYIYTLRKWKYNLTSTYFKSPWTLLSVVAATSILGLTATQTVYTILSYVNRETSPLTPS